MKSTFVLISASISQRIRQPHTLGGENFVDPLPFLSVLDTLLLSGNLKGIICTQVFKAKFLGVHYQKMNAFVFGFTEFRVDIIGLSGTLYPKQIKEEKQGKSLPKKMQRSMQKQENQKNIRFKGNDSHLLTSI